MRLRLLVVFIMLVAFVIALPACSGGEDDDMAKKKAEMEAKLAAIKKQKETKSGGEQGRTTEIKMTTAQEVLDEVGLDYQYDPINKPDPFRPYRPASDIMQQSSDNPLLKFEVRYFSLVGIVRDTENPMAIFEDPSGKSYTVHVGDPIGKNGGVVRQITDDTVIVTETRISWRTEGTETVEITIRLRPEDTL